MRTTSSTISSTTAASNTITTASAAQRRHLDDELNHSLGESNKRIRQHEGNDDGADDMDVDMTPIKPPPPAAASSNTTNPDDILVAMVQSGNHTHDEVVQFCLQSGIPLSRMLRLDLMRLSDKNKDDGRAPPKG